MGPTYRLRNRRRINKHGFRARMKSVWGRATLSPRRKKGRKQLVVSIPSKHRSRYTSERYPRRVRITRGSELTSWWEAGGRRRTRHLDFAWRHNLSGHARLG